MSYTIYFIENEVNQKGYVGMTGRTLKARLEAHIARARGGVRDQHFHRAIRKYGAENFRIFPIEEVKGREEAYQREKHWIDLLGTYEGDEYNESPGGEGVGVGGDNPISDLTEEDVYEMRLTYFENDQLSARKLAEEYDVTPSTAASIVRGDHWSHVEMPEGLTDEYVDGQQSRISRGEGGLSKLSKEMVLEIRERASEEGETLDNLAEDYPVKRGAIYEVVTGRTWAHVGGPIIELEGVAQPGEKHKSSKLTAEKVREMRRQHEEEGLTVRELSRRYEVTPANAGMVIKGETWTHVDGPTTDEVDIENRGVSKLTAEDVRQIRERYKRGDISRSELAEQYPITESNVGNIVTGETWGHVGGPTVEAGVHAADSDLSKLTAEQVKEIRKRYNRGDITQAELAEEYPVSQSGIASIINEDTWTHIDGPTVQEDVRGGKGKGSKLTAEEVKEIRERYQSDEVTQQELAEEYPISLASINSILRGENWSHVGGPIAEKSAKGEDSKLAKLTAEDVREIRRRYEEEDVSQADLAEEYPTSRPNIGMIVRRESWTHID